MTDVGPDRQEPFPNRSFADIVTQVEPGPSGAGRPTPTSTCGSRRPRPAGSCSASAPASSGGLSGNLIVHEKNFDLFNFPRSFRDFTSGQAFRGAGQDFRLELSPGTLINRAVVSFRDPYLFDLPIGLGASGYAFQRLYPDFNESRGGGRFSLGSQFGTQTYADVAVRVEDVDFYGFRSPAPADYLAAAGHTTLATLRPSLRFDNRNDPFVPNKGQYLEFAFEQGWGDFTFPKFTVEGRQHFTTRQPPRRDRQADPHAPRLLRRHRPRHAGLRAVLRRRLPQHARLRLPRRRPARPRLQRRRHHDGHRLGRVPVPADRQRQAPAGRLLRLRHRRARLHLHHLPRRRRHRPPRRPPGSCGPLPLAFDLAFPVSKDDGDKTRTFTFFIGAFW